MLIVLSGCSKNEVLSTNENVDNNELSLSQYLGKFYATTLDEEHNFDINERFVSDEINVWGIELEIVEIDDNFYAYLSTNLNPSKKFFVEQKKDADNLLPVIFKDNNIWEIIYDENNGDQIVGTAVLSLNINPAGKLFVEISGKYSCPKTPLYSLEQWQGGMYKKFDFNKSVDVFGKDITYCYSPIDCELFLRNTFYRKWYEGNSGFVVDDNIYVVSYSTNSFRGYTQELCYYNADDLNTLHHAYFEDETGQEMVLDGTTYYSDISVFDSEYDENNFEERKTFIWDGSYGEWITDSEILNYFHEASTKYLEDNWWVDDFYSAVDRTFNFQTEYDKPIRETLAVMVTGNYNADGDVVFKYRESLDFGGGVQIVVTRQATMKTDSTVTFLSSGIYYYDTLYLRTRDCVNVEYYNPQTGVTEFGEWDIRDDEIYWKR